MAITTNFAYCLKSHHGSKGILSLATTPYGFFTKTSRFREVSANFRYQKYYRLRILGSNDLSAVFIFLCHFCHIWAFCQLKKAFCQLDNLFGTFLV